MSRSKNSLSSKVFELCSGADIVWRIKAKKKSLTDSFSDGSPGEWNLINDKPNVFV